MPYSTVIKHNLIADKVPKNLESGGVLTGGGAKFIRTKVWDYIPEPQPQKSEIEISAFYYYLLFSSFSRESRPARTTSGQATKGYETRRPPEKEMVFGIRAIIEAIDAGKTLDKILLRRDMTSTIGKELLKKLMGTTTPVQKVPVEKLNQYTDKNHQGAIAFLSPIEFCNIETLIPTLYEEGKTPLLMVLDGVTDDEGTPLLYAGVPTIGAPWIGGIIP